MHVSRSRDSPCDPSLAHEDARACHRPLHRLERAAVAFTRAISRVRVRVSVHGRARLVVALLVLLASHSHAESSVSNWYYADLRGAFEVDDDARSQAGVANYASRLGWRTIWKPDRTRPLRTVFLAELGLQEERGQLGLDGTRLFFIALRGAHGQQLAVGRQRTAFYSTVGRFVDVGLRQTDFGYEGSNRLAIVSYTREDIDSRFQLDLTHDPVKSGGGVNRLQAGFISRRHPWQFGVAIDVSTRGSTRFQSIHRAGERPRALCDHDRVSCLAGMLGWAADDMSLSLTLLHGRTRHQDFTTWTAASQWKPNDFGYYALVSAHSGDTRKRLGFTAGASYHLDQYSSIFVEASRRRYVSGSADIEHLLGVGLRLEYDSYW